MRDLASNHENPALPFGLTLFLLVALASVAPAEIRTETLKLPNGNTVELEIHLPDSQKSVVDYNVVVSPGEYYWGKPEAHSRWIVVVSDAFFGPQSSVNAKPTLDWIREHYPPLGGGFHMAGWSANSAGVFEIVSNHPGDFLSITGIAGMPGRNSEDAMLALKAVRIQFIVGENDSYWRQGSERWHEFFLEKGADSRIEVIPNGPHVIEELIGSPIFDRLNKLLL